MTLDPIAITIRVTNILETLGVPYFISGSIASTLYGTVRTTQDSDIIAALQIEHVPEFMSQLQNDFYMDDLMILDAVQNRSSFNIIHRETFFKVDVFVPKPRAFLQKQFSRAQKELLSADQATSANVASPEDTILAKLEWYRLGGEVSQRQWSDILGIFKVQTSSLDVGYLRSMAIELGIEDLLSQALDASG